MKNGIVRSIDSVGRLVLPKEWRDALDIKAGDLLEMFFEGDSIRVKKHEPACIFCQGKDNIREYKGKNVCSKCVHDLSTDKK